MEYITLDASSVITLFAASKDEAWDLLLAGGKNVILTKATLDEVERFQAVAIQKSEPLQDVFTEFWEYP